MKKVDRSRTVTFANLILVDVDVVLWTLDNFVSVKNAFSGRGGGQVVSVFAFYYDDPSSNPVKAYSLFLENLCLKRKKIYKKRPDWPIFKNKFLNCWAQGFF